MMINHHPSYFAALFATAFFVLLPWTAAWGEAALLSPQVAASKRARSMGVDQVDVSASNKGIRYTSIGNDVVSLSGIVVSPEDGVNQANGKKGKKKHHHNNNQTPPPTINLPFPIGKQVQISTNQQYTPGQNVLQLGICLVQFSSQGQLIVSKNGVELFASPLVKNPSQLVFQINGVLAIVDSNNKVLWEPKVFKSPSASGVLLTLDSTCLFQMVDASDSGLLYSPFWMGDEIITPKKQNINMTSPFFMGSGQCRAMMEGGDLVVAKQLNSTTMAVVWRSPSAGLGQIFQILTNGTMRVAGLQYDPIRQDLPTLWRAFPYPTPFEPSITAVDERDCLLFAFKLSAAKQKVVPQSDVLFSSSGVRYYGGSVMPNVVVHQVFWGTSWANSTYRGDRVSVLQEMYQSLYPTLYLDLLDQYLLGQTPHVSFGSSTIDPTKFPTVTKKNQNNVDLVIAKRVCTLLHDGTIQTNTAGNLSTLYFPTYVDQLLPAFSGYCAFHEAFICKNGKAERYVTSMGKVDSADVLRMGFFWDFSNEPGCLVENGLNAKLRSGIAAAMARVSAHELFETMTDDVWWNAGWFTTYPPGEEISDLCYKLEAQLTLADGKGWMLPAHWSNADAACSWGPGTKVTNVIPWYGLPTASPTVVSAPTVKKTG